MKQRKKPFSFADFFQSFKNVKAFNKLSNEHRNIVFYSESGQDWHHFKDIIVKLLDMQKKICYVTSDKSDPGLHIVNKNYKSFFISEGFWQISFSSFLKLTALFLQ